MSQPRFLHELTDDRAGEADAPPPEADAPPSEATAPCPSDVNVFEACAPVDAPAPEDPAAAPPAARVVEGFHTALESIVIPALATLAEQRRRLGWRPLALVAVAVGLVAVVGSSLTGGDEKHADMPAAKAAAGAPRPAIALARVPETDAAVAKRAAEQLRASRHARADTPPRERDTARRGRPDRREVRRRPRPAETPAMPLEVSAPPAAPPPPVQAPQAPPAEVSDEFGFEQ